MKETIISIPPNVKKETLKAIADLMGDKPYRLVIVEKRYGWNELIPVTK
uniref:Uncharacterized protein n=1 Tax=viral metagenome TaxID=1070528 RepID=A0A6M3LXE3_9ZZZZ